MKQELKNMKFNLLKKYFQCANTPENYYAYSKIIFRMKKDKTSSTKNIDTEIVSMLIKNGLIKKASTKNNSKACIVVNGEFKPIAIPKQKIIKASKKKKKYHEYLRSPEWKEIRKIVIGIRGDRCERCKSKNNLQVHHKSYKYVMKEMDHLEDLELICGRCHRKEHKIK